MPEYGYQQSQAASFDSEQTIRKLTPGHSDIQICGNQWQALGSCILHCYRAYLCAQAQRQGLESYHGPLAFGCQQNPELMESSHEAEQPPPLSFDAFAFLFHDPTFANSNTTIK